MASGLPSILQQPVGLIRPPRVEGGNHATTQASARQRSGTALMEWAIFWFVGLLISVVFEVIGDLFKEIFGPAPSRRRRRRR